MYRKCIPINLARDSSRQRSWRDESRKTDKSNIVNFFYNLSVSSVTILSKDNQRLLGWERAAKISPGLITTTTI